MQYNMKNTEATTENIKVFVKWRYRANFVSFLLNRKVLVVLTKALKIHQHIAESKTANGTYNQNISKDSSRQLNGLLEQLIDL